MNKHCKYNIDVCGKIICCEDCSERTIKTCLSECKEVLDTCDGLIYEV